MTEELKDQGLAVGHRRVGRLMNENNINVIRSRKHKVTIDNALMSGDFPSAKRQAPSAKRQAPSAKRQAPSAKRQAPSAKRPQSLAKAQFQVAMQAISHNLKRFVRLGVDQVPILSA